MSYRVQSMLAGVLGMPLANVRVIGHYMGGGFGSKLQADKSSVLAAVFARVTRTTSQAVPDPRRDVLERRESRPPPT